MDRITTTRALQPRPQQGTSLSVSLTIHATDEGVYLARLAWRDSATQKLLVQHGTKVMWQGGTDDVQHFASDVAGALMDVVEWTIA